MPLIFAGLLAVGIIAGMFLQSSTLGFMTGGGQKKDKIHEVLEFVQEGYVDTLSREELQNRAIDGLLRELDPHSVYISPAEFHEANDPLMGSFEGIGVQFRIEKDTITVINPVSGGPSEKLGIRAGDRIVKINDTLVAGKKISNRDVMRKLKGPRGTEVKVSIFRRGTAGFIDYTITRDVIPTYSLDIAYMVDATTGYIRLNNFSATTAEEFNAALQRLTGLGMKELILDLQGNGGGLLKAAAEVANEFLSKDDLIVYTEGAHRSREYFYANRKGLFREGKVIVLIDEWSASASEILAGAIQDNDRGTIIGRRSFGKGLVQEQVNFRDGSALRLTVARYYTPSGRCIQKPYDSNGDESYEEYYHRNLRGEPQEPDSTKIPDSLKYKTRTGRTVYGGGGILPDIYIPHERDSLLVYYNLLINKGLIYRFAFDYTDANRKTLNRLTNLREFDAGFIVTDKIFNDLVRFAEENGVKRTPGNNTESDRLIKVMLKAYVGRNVIDNDGFFPYLNQIDPVFLAAMESLGK